MSREPTGSSDDSGSKRRWWIAGALGAVVLAILIQRYGGELSALASDIAQDLADMGWTGGLAFAAAGTLWIALFLPASVIFLTAGAIWGLQWGLVLALAANFFAGIVAFGLARRWLATRIEDADPAESKLALVRAAVQNEGLRGTALLRFSALPVWAVNYGLGAARVSWRDYLLASVAIVPNTWVYVAAGDAVGLGGDVGSRSPTQWAMLGASIAVTLVVMALLGRRAKRLLDQALDDSSPADESSPNLQA